MSCEECELRQNDTPIAYYRWDVANIAMKGCDKHLREIFDVLNLFQNASREGKLPLLLHPESWQNLFHCIRHSTIKSEGNFWAAIQEIERQFEEQIK